MSNFLDDLIMEVDEVDDRVVVTEKGFEMLRAGLLCSNCFQDLRPVGSFPEQCPLCRFPVREMQMANLERKHIGHVEMGSRLSLSDELERMGELWRPSE